MLGTLAGLSPPISPINPMTVTTLKKIHEVRPRTPSRQDEVEARRRIDHEMQRLEDTMRALKSRRNMLAPISYLPPEILSKVFFYCASESTDHKHPLGWIKVSHVSRHWRAVALNSPNLWGAIVFSRPKWVEEMLKRSKMASLIVKADLTWVTPKVLESVQIALRHSARIRELGLVASSTTLDKLFDNSPINLPNLHTLSFAVPRKERFGIPFGYILPETVLEGNFPYLRRLELTKCNIGWDSPLLTDLTHLKICDVSSISRSTTTQVLDALERMGALEVLDLHEALPLVPDDAVPSPVDRVVALPRLSHVAISSSVPECANLLQRITIPDTATIKLLCKGTDATDHDFSTIFNILPHLGGAIRTDNDEKVFGQPLHALHVQNAMPTSLVIQGWSIGTTSRDIISRSQPRIDLQLSWPRYEHSALEGVMTAACKALPLVHLRCLRLSHLDHVSLPAWRDTFGNLSKLHTLHVVANSPHSLIDALCGVPLANTQKVTTTTPALRRRKSMVPAFNFPQLRTLILEATNFNESSEGISLDKLLDCLMMRCEYKAEIHELRLDDCSYVLYDDIKLLKEIVAEVQWDGIEQGFTDDEVDEDVYFGYEYYDLEDSDITSHPFDEFEPQDFGFEHSGADPIFW